MKQEKVKKQWKPYFGILFVSLFMVVLSCDSEMTAEMEVADLPHQVTAIEARIARSEIRDKVKQNKHKTNRESNTALETLLEQVNMTVLSRKFYNEQGTAFYTFALNKQQTQNRSRTAYYSDNLFVNITASNEIKYYLFRYTPSETWLNSNDDLSRYSGKVQWLSKDKQVIATLSMKNGQPIEDTTNRTNCFLVHKSTLCVPPSYPGLPTQCSHYYELVCPGGGDGPPTPTNPDDPGGDGSGGGSDALLLAVVPL